ncbi:hypothetical protein LAG90_10530 [Marinilongibacter aquaticus]|uniref:mechanosensitive ion channel family protein n=1 Tax=Marinilongibacter aquaticus TaxID=2975157 RepID=UPI0021BD3362|nr:hypothetical protein [Marinilongibacter aquaticus]UBM61014.1 hypothetical protein LAG90_10530 [Marinilongibacter aquaticus]
MKILPNIKEILVETFQRFVTQVGSFAIDFFGALVIVIVGWGIAKILSVAIRNVLSRIGIDRVGEKINEIDAVKKLGMEIVLSKVVAKVVYYFVLLFILMTASDALGIPAISNMFAMIVDFIPKLIVAVIMIMAGLLLAEAVKQFVIGLCKSFNVESGKLIGMGVFFFVMVVTLIAALGQAGINTALLESSFNILIAGVILSFSIGYGFASREILLNIISSFYSKKRYQEGQVVEIEGVKGEIVRIDSTSIVLNDGETETVFPLRVLQTHKVILHKK